MSCFFQSNWLYPFPPFFYFYFICMYLPPYRNETNRSPSTYLIYYYFITINLYGLSCVEKKYKLPTYVLHETKLSWSVVVVYPFIIIFPFFLY